MELAYMRIPYQANPDQVGANFYLGLGSGLSIKCAFELGKIMFIQLDVRYEGTFIDLY